MYSNNPLINSKRSEDDDVGDVVGELSPKSPTSSSSDLFEFIRGLLEY